MSSSLASLLVFAGYMVAVFALAIASNRVGQGKSFVAEYFLGSRGLGTWALAFTFAASMASGGSFTGFPAKIFSHGWIVAFWIAGYMIFPLLTMGLLGKRLNQVSRRGGAITIPDLVRERYDSPGLGLATTAAILFFAVVNMIAQFRVGGLILEVLLEGTPGYQSYANQAGEYLRVLTYIPFIRDSVFEPTYAFSLVLFSLIVVIYTAYGGFRAVVWTDVLQGVVMGLGVILLLPLTLYMAGGLQNVSEKLVNEPAKVTIGSFKDNNAIEYVAKTSENTLFIEHKTTEAHELSYKVVDYPVENSGKLIQIYIPQYIEVPQNKKEAKTEKQPVTAKYFVNWFNKTDFMNAYCEAVLVDPANTAHESRLAQNLGDGLVEHTPSPLVLTDGVHKVFGPGRSADGDPFLPFMTALGFFVMWAFTGAGQPHTMVRLMAFKDTKILRRAIITVTIYYLFIYIPLIIIFVASQVLVHPAELAGSADRVMPTMVVKVAPPLLAGILIAAPFAAVMSTVDSYLLLISSGLVRDVYQRNINPNVSERTIKILSYTATVSIGLVVTLLSLDPPEFIQDIIVFTGIGAASTFLATISLGMYWKGMTKWGAVASMAGGFFSVVLIHLPPVLARYNLTFLGSEIIEPLGIPPVLIGLGSSFLLGVVVSWYTPKPHQDLVNRFFAARPRNPKPSSSKPEPA